MSVCGILGRSSGENVWARESFCVFLIGGMYKKKRGTALETDIEIVRCRVRVGKIG